MLTTQLLACKNPNADNLCLIHGWAAQNAVWKDWAEKYLSPEFNVTLIELPGFGTTPSLASESDWLDAIIAVLPEKTHLVGWSLGGLLAQQVTLAQPQRILSLTCLGSTPRFTQNDDWPLAVAPSLIGDFIKSIHVDSSATLKHFWKLQLQGGDNARSQMRQFLSTMQALKMPTLSGLTQGLTLLKTIDNREKLSAITCPVCWLMGEKDPLIPVDCVTKISAQMPDSRISVIEGAGHTPFHSHPAETAAKLLSFLREVKA